MTERGDEADVRRVENPRVAIRRAAHIIAVVLLVLIGLAGVALGMVISALADRSAIAGIVAGEAIGLGFLSEAQLVELIHAFMWWGGVGLTLAGVLVFLGGVAFAVLSRRTETFGHARHRMVSNAVLGALVTALTSLVPFSPLIGGAVAGYLQHEDVRAGLEIGLRVGGLVAAPVVVFAIALAVGIHRAGFVMIGILVTIAMAFSVVITIILAGIGGYVGAYLDERERRAETS